MRERKGEHVQLIAQLRSQGFIRARIDGEIVNWIKLRALDLRKKHTIEVVVDRIKVRPSVRQRLAESFETALKLAEGLAGMAFMDPKARRRTNFFRAFCLSGMWL